MAHNLSIKNGRAQMFYYGEKPWHGLGTELNAPATAKEAIKAAQLDYIVEKQPLITMVGNQQVHVPEKKATVRMDTRQVLGVVGDGYRVIQNTEAFSFFDTVVGEGQAVYHTAGALGQGERIWILAKLPKDLIIAREDIVEKYLILTNSHDGTSALKLYFSPVRVVCQNTLVMSLKDSRDGITIRHSGDIKSKADEARRILGISLKFYQEFGEVVDRLVEHKMTVKSAEGYFDNVVFGMDPENRDSKVLINRRNDLLTLFERGKGNDIPEVKHSAWAALNACTEYSDHYRTIKGEKEDRSNRLNSIWFGAAAAFKRTAYNEICKVVGITK